jgi:hypothetical protein
MPAVRLQTYEVPGVQLVPQDMAGIRQTPAGAFEVKVYDPWPGSGIGWRTLAGWYTGFSPGTHGVSSRDSSAGVEAVFLHAP